jgi:hypothetical protein
MATAEKPRAVPQDVIDSLQEAVDRALKGIRDPEAARKVCQEIDRA